MIGIRSNNKCEMVHQNRTSILLDSRTITKLNPLRILNKTLHRTCNNINRFNILQHILSSVSILFAFLSKNKNGGR